MRRRKGKYNLKIFYDTETEDGDPPPSDFFFNRRGEGELCVGRSTVAFKSTHFERGP